MLASPAEAQKLKSPRKLTLAAVLLTGMDPSTVMFSLMDEGKHFSR
jgi:hypothetical protein